MVNAIVGLMISQGSSVLHKKTVGNLTEYNIIICCFKGFVIFRNGNNKIKNPNIKIKKKGDKLWRIKILCLTCMFFSLYVIPRIFSHDT